MRMSFKKIICIVLSAAILITTINLSAIPVSAISTVRISLDPIPNEVYVPSGDFEMDILSDVMEEPNYNIITNNRKNDWGALTFL